MLENSEKTKKSPKTKKSTAKKSQKSKNPTKKNEKIEKTVETPKKSKEEIAKEKSEWRKSIILAIKKDMVAKKTVTEEHLTDLYAICLEELNENPDFDKKWWFSVTGYIKKEAFKLLEQHLDEKHADFYDKVLLLEAPHRFDSYLLYLEKDRQPKDRFYQPKIKQFEKLGLIKAMQALEDDEINLLTISMPPGTQKTTLEKFFASWIIGRHPDDYSLFFSHSGDITRIFYDGVLDITTSEEYRWADIFPNVKLQGTDAKRECINFNGYKPFSNLQCTSVGSKNAGKVRCNRYLYCDDLIGGIEEALNKNILDKLWRIYSTDARQRKLNDQVKEIHIATRWSVHDVIGRLQRAYVNDDRARFIAVSDIDETTGESNFNYDYNGLSIKFFKDQEMLMDEISYKCLYKNQPIEREGLLYHDDELRRYLELPLREPDAIIGVCDTKEKGTDYLVLPVMYQYDDDYYMADCICSNDSDYGVQYERMTNIILQHNMQQVEFESNMGGNRIAFEVDKRIKEVGGRCNITTKPTESNKETRIIVNADWIKKHVLFKDTSLYSGRDDYGIFMNWLLSYSIAGKNVHDDIPDTLANFALYVNKTFNQVPVMVFSRSRLGL